MRDCALLDLARKIVHEHQRENSDESVLVIPAIHDAIDLDHASLEAIAARYDGEYIRCDDMATPPYEAHGPINETMARYLVQLCASRNLAISIDERDGRVIAVSDEKGEATGSLPMILRVLAVLASADMNKSLVILSYSLDGLDEVRAALLWEATLTPGYLAPPLLRTFVPIAAGDVDVARHCNRTEGAVRLVVRGGELIERGASILLSDCLPMILSDVNDPIILFLGAGASASCNMPQGNYLRDQALASLTQKPMGSPELVSSFRRWLTNHDRWLVDEDTLPADVFERNLTLERVLREEFYSLGGKPRDKSFTVQRLVNSCERALDRLPEGRKALWKLAEILPRLVIATVNFDQLIEVGIRVDHCVIVGKDKFAEHRNLIVDRVRDGGGPVPILKLHGSIDDPGSLVADITATTRGLPAEIVGTLDTVLNAGGYLTWVWIGCSMRDADIGAWLAGKSGITDMQEWWVDPLPPRSVSAYAEMNRLMEWAQLPQKLRDRQITETSDRFLSALADHAVRLESRSE